MGIGALVIDKGEPLPFSIGTAVALVSPELETGDASDTGAREAPGAVDAVDVETGTFALIGAALDEFVGAIAGGMDDVLGCCDLTDVAGARLCMVGMSLTMGDVLGSPLGPKVLAKVPYGELDNGNLGSPLGGIDSAPGPGGRLARAGVSEGCKVNPCSGIVEGMPVVYGRLV